MQLALCGGGVFFCFFFKRPSGSAVEHSELLADVHPLKECVQRGEGVVLVLRWQALAAWRHGGQQWKAWSSRCVSAVLQVDKRTVIRIHVVSCYALTRAAHREDKDAFFQELEHIISGVPSGETYIILGDFNACVGSRESYDDEWSNVRGPYGLGSVNDAGKEVLSFLSIHQAMMCNKWYQKKETVKYGNSQNPNSGAVWTLQS